MSGLKLIGVILGLSVLAASCASIPGTGAGKGKQAYQPDQKAIERMLDQEVGSINSGVVERILAEPPPRAAGKGKTKSNYAASKQRLENEMQRQVWWWLRYYTVRDRARFVRNLERGENYRPLVQQILRENQLPQELYYLGLIESGYVTQANSGANAMGIWQFMRPTALQYGLGVSGSFDERRHPVAATHAAARYLRDLHKQFKSWYLAIAAYNAGQGRIARAVKRGRTTDFWRLAERKLIPRETMEYIPKFLAAVTIGQNQETFGFVIRPSQQEWPEIASVDFKLSDMRKFKSGRREQDIARLAGLDLRDLRRFNPQLRQALARRDVKAIRIWMPKESVDRFVIPHSMVADKGRRTQKRKI